MGTTANELSAAELNALVERVFAPRADERAMAVIVDLPDATTPDRPAWRERRRIAGNWVERLQATHAEHGLSVGLFLYRNVRANNADLPDAVWPHPPRDLPASAEELADRGSRPFEAVLAEHPLVLAPTELSTTAPLKVLAPRLGFRAATMPGFSPAMTPALRLDYAEVNRRVDRLKALLDRALEARLVFVVDARDQHHLVLDLRHRTAHASGGLLREPGVAGNLPSGEAYIVPYEGEIDGEPSRSAGTLPIELEGEVVLFKVEGNRALRVVSQGPASDAQRRRLGAEPAYGNLAELGLGVLSELGVEPIGEVLLDEKLGLHIAFGRSEHFGGQVGPDDFSSPDAVVHQDHVFVPALQPRVAVAHAYLALDDGSEVELMRDGHYAIGFAGSG